MHELFGFTSDGHIVSIGTATISRRWLNRRYLKDQTPDDNCLKSALRGTVSAGTFLGSVACSDVFSGRRLCGIVEAQRPTERFGVYIPASERDDRHAVYISQRRGDNYWHAEPCQRQFGVGLPIRLIDLNDLGGNVGLRTFDYMLSSMIRD